MAEGSRVGLPPPIVSMVNECPMPAIAVSPDGRILLLNREAEKLLNVQDRSLEGNPLSDVLPNLSREEEEVESAGTGRASPPLFATIRRSSRDHRRLRVYRTPLPPTDESPGGALYQLCDLSEIAALEKEYADLRFQFSAFVDESTDVYFLLRHDLQLLYVNPAVRTVFGFEASEWVGRSLELPVFLPSEEVRRISVLGTQELFRRGFRNKLFRFYRRDGTLFWGLMSLVPSRKSRSSPALIGILRDVSEFYETREQLVQQQNQLRRTIERLEEASRLQDQFVANITHELRTPLTTVLISTEVLLRDTADILPVQKKRQLELIMKNSTALLDIINDLLDLAKLKKGGFEVQQEAVELEDFVSSLLEEVEPLYSEKELYLNWKPDGDLPGSFRCDPHILRKILLNLLSNAFKFTKEGGATLTIQSSGPVLRFIVTDTGTGIPLKEINTIFKEFRQVDGSDSRRYPGTGLGLSIAERFTRLLGGTITVESVIGKGSSFTVTVPVAGTPASYEKE
jgi:PAS domain S-box-containing protein